jgi:hypothetical protein
VSAQSTIKKLRDENAELWKPLARAPTRRAMLTTCASSTTSQAQRGRLPELPNHTSMGRHVQSAATRLRRCGKILRPIDSPDRYRPVGQCMKTISVWRLQCCLIKAAAPENAAICEPSVRP